MLVCGTVRARATIWRFKGGAYRSRASNGRSKRNRDDDADERNDEGDQGKTDASNPESDKKERGNGRPLVDGRFLGREREWMNIKWRTGRELDWGGGLWTLHFRFETTGARPLS